MTKTIWLFISPFSIVIAMLLTAIVLISVGRVRTGRWVLCVGTVLLTLASLPFVANYALRILEDPFPPRRIEEIPRADAIVILGGSVEPARRSGGSENLLQAADRIIYGFRLFRAGLAPLIVVSGGGKDTLGRPVSEAALMAQLLEEWGVPPGAIRLEEISLDTRGNALGCERLLKSSGIDEILLVTSAAHMGRALATFRRVGFVVGAAPTDHESTDAINFAIGNWIPKAEALAFTSQALREYLAQLYYWSRGWTIGKVDAVGFSSGSAQP